jgi:hypothetical protein
MIFVNRNRLKNLVKQLFPTPSRHEMETAGDRVLQRLKEEFPDRVDEFRFQARPNQLPPLDPFERTVLLAVDRVSGGDTDRVCEQIDALRHLYTYGGVSFDVLTSLDRLGLVSSKRIPGRNDYHRLWTITDLGSRVLARKRMLARAAEKVLDFA